MMPGSRYPKVLPEPVWAIPTMSWKLFAHIWLFLFVYPISFYMFVCCSVFMCLFVNLSRECKRPSLRLNRSRFGVTSVPGYSDDGGDGGYDGGEGGDDDVHGDNGDNGGNGHGILEGGKDDLKIALSL